MALAYNGRVGAANLSEDATIKLILILVKSFQYWLETSYRDEYFSFQKFFKIPKF